MNRARLLHTARQVLPFVKPERFNMGVWKCGSAACAFGHEAMTKYANRQGLKLVRDGARNFSPWYRGELTIGAAVEYYDISYDMAMWIFSPNAYSHVGHIEPATVAERIESLLAANPINETMHRNLGMHVLWQDLLP